VISLARPAPLAAALEAELGPFAVGTLTVSPQSAVGYGGAVQMVAPPRGGPEGQRDLRPPEES
jgi:hypothetical protein